LKKSLAKSSVQGCNAGFHLIQKAVFILFQAKIKDSILLLFSFNEKTIWSKDFLSSLMSVINFILKNKSHKKTSNEKTIATNIFVNLFFTIFKFLDILFY
jgi:hypothetical protein